MKKTITLLTALAVLFTLTACGKKEADSETTPPSSAENTTVTTAPSTTNSTTAATEPEDIFEEIVLVDNEHVTVKITGVEQDAILGYTLKVFTENKTDMELMLTVEDVSVNGYMCDPFWAETVAGGKKSNTSIFWLESSFEENGIEAVEEITFTLRAYDNNDWLSEDVVNETITVNF